MMNALNVTDEENEFRLETSEHEDADSDDLPLSFLQKMSQNSIDFENLKLSSEVNNLNNAKDTCRISSESTKETVSKNSSRIVEQVCLTSELVHVLGSQSVETKCSSYASEIGSYDVFHSKSVQCDIPSTNEVTQFDIPKNSTTQSRKITYPSSDLQLVSQRTQYDNADCQITQSDHGAQTSKLLHISEGIQCDLDDGISNNVVSSSNPLSDFELIGVNRCMCCKRDLEACEFSDTVNGGSERIPKNNAKEKEIDLEKRLSSPKRNEHLCDGGEIKNASQNPITSSKNISSPVLSTTNKDGMKTNKDALPSTNTEQTSAVSSSQNHRDICITTSSSDGSTCDIYLDKETKKAPNNLQNKQLPNVITRNEYSSAFETVEKADYVASWINNLVPESALSRSMAEETEDVLQSNEKAYKTALLESSKRPVTSIKKRVNSANKCGSNINNEISQISLSGTSESVPEILRTKSKCSNEIFTTNNRRNMLMDHSCERFSERKKNPVSLQLDVEHRNGISSAIPVEREEFVLSWVDNLVPECASLPPSSDVRHRETEDVVEINQEISNAGTLRKYNKRSIRTAKKRRRSVMNCGKDASDESSGLFLSSPEMLRTENNQCNRSLLQQHNRVGERSLSSVSKSSNIELVRELQSEDLECAKAFEEFLASYYYKDMKEYERTERNKFLYSKTKLNEESTLRQMKHHNKPLRKSNCNPSGRMIQQKFVVQENQSDDSSLGVRSPGKRKYICLSGVKPDNTQNESKRKVRQCYTVRERIKIINYIIEKNKFSSVKGIVLWKDMERAKVCDRTWQSMKEHFRKQILPGIEYYKLEPGILQKFLSLRK